MRRMRKRGPDTDRSSKSQAVAESLAVVRQESALREMNERLHELCQPMTVLLCTLELSAELDSMEEIGDATRVARDACERLRQTVAAMQALMREAIEVGERTGDWEDDRES